VTKEFILGILFCRMRADIFAETLAGIRESTIRPTRLIIVNNGGDPHDIADAQVIRPNHNLGCAGGWNRVMSECRTGITILLNDDCRVAPDTFEKMLDEDAPVVLASGFSCFRLDVHAWRTVGPFDELFWPAYFEDADYRIRLTHANIPLIEWPIDETETGIPGRTRKPSGIVHGFWAGPEEYRRWTNDRYRAFRACYELNKVRYREKWNDGAYERPFDGKPDFGVGGRSAPGAELLR
jgi:hypothetical protein